MDELEKILQDIGRFPASRTYAERLQELARDAFQIIKKENGNVQDISMALQQEIPIAIESKKLGNRNMRHAKTLVTRCIISHLDKRKNPDKYLHLNEDVDSSD